MSIGRTLTLAGILAGSMIIGTAVPSIALWTTSSTPLTASASAGTMGANVRTFDALTQVYTRDAVSNTLPVSFENTGNLPTGYTENLTLAAGTLDGMAGKVALQVWPQSADAACTPEATPPATAWTGTWKSLAATGGALIGEIAPTSSVTWCVRSSLAPADQDELLRASGSATPTVTPNLTLTLSAGAWTATASATATQTVKDVVPPSTPLNVKAANITATSAKLSWSASTDNVRVVGYRVYQSIDAGATYQLLGTSTTTTYNVGGLLPLRAYKFAVRAYDAAENESVQSEAAPATAAAPASSTWYRLQLDKNSKCMDVDLTSGNAPSGTALIQWDCHFGTNQQFRFDSSGKIIPRNNTALGWAASNSAAGASLTVKTSANTWVLEPDSSSAVSYRIRLKDTNLCASVKAPALSDKDPLELRMCGSGSVQTFTLKEMP